MEVRFHRLAAREYRDARAWYDRRRAGLGNDLEAEVERAVGRIITHPTSRPVFRDPYRRVQLRRFPFALYYHITDDTLILVLAVAHARRRPGYWLRRASR